MGSQPNASALEPDVRRVFDSLRWIVRELRLHPATGDRATGLSVAQVFVLQVLKDQGPLSVGDLAEQTATDPSSVSVVVRKLHDKGLVAKHAAPGDRRKLTVSLTAAGVKIATKSPIPVQQVLIGRMAQLAPDQLRCLADLLERLATPVDGAHPAPMFFHEGAAGGRRS